MPGDVALSYKHMMDKLTPEQRKECVLVWHSAISDENGTDMRAVCRTLLTRLSSDIYITIIVDLLMMKK